MNNQVSVQGGDETGTFNFSIENQKIAGVVPHDKSERTGTRLSATKEYGKLTVGFNAGYTQVNYDQTSYDFYNDVIQQAASVPLK